MTLRSLDPHPSVTCADGEVFATEAGRTAKGLTASVEVLMGSGMYRDVVALSVAKDRGRFAKEVAENFECDREALETALVKLAQEVEKSLRESEASRAAVEPRNVEVNPPKPSKKRFGDYATWRSADGEYAVLNGRFYRVRHDDKGNERLIKLSNFAARIKEEAMFDDGVEVARFFFLEGCLHNGRQLARERIAARQFNALNWHVDVWGFGPSILPGYSTREHVRVAIEQFSGEAVKRRTVYTHLGWRELRKDKWIYLHGGGAIDAHGVVAGVEVQLNDALSLFELPEPPAADALRSAVRRSLGILDVAPDRVTVPVLIAPFHAVTVEPDLSIDLCGPTGQGKTELASLAQRFFGAGMEARKIPASWSSTANSLEALAFETKNALLVVDDFAPTGTSYDIQRFHASADRLLRAQGNRSGRQRMRADGTLRPARPPRGLIFCTGEDVPRGQSLRARMVIVELGPGDVSWEKLTECQEAASSGVYAAVMAGYVKWCASRRGDLPWTSRSSRETYREGTHSETSSHKRSSANFVSLSGTFEVFLEFARAVGAIDEAESEALRARAADALTVLECEQEQLQASQEPTRRFFELLVAAISSGHANVANSDGSAPSDAKAWGWEMSTITRDASLQWRPRGDRIGWLGENGALFLEPEASFAAVQRVGRDTGEALEIGSRTLHRRLREKGFLIEHEGGRLTVRRDLQGSRRRVLHVHRDSLTSTNWSDWSRRDLTDDGERTSGGPVAGSSEPRPDSTGPGGVPSGPARTGSADPESGTGPDVKDSGGTPSEDSGPVGPVDDGYGWERGEL